MKKLSDYLFGQFRFNEAILLENSYEHLGFEKPLQSFSARDPVNQWRSKVLLKHIHKELEAAGFYTEEMKNKINQMNRYQQATYASFLLGMVFGALVINPTYIGKTTRSLRKLMPFLTGFAFYSSFKYTLNKYTYLVHIQFYPKVPLEYRSFMQTRDHRYLMFIDEKSLRLKA